MKRSNLALLVILAIAASVTPARPVRAEIVEVRLENKQLARTIGLSDGRLATLALTNKRCAASLTPVGHEEFRLRLSTDVNAVEPDLILTSADFEVVSLTGNAERATAELRSPVHGLNVRVVYTLAPQAFYGHKQLIITSTQRRVLELIDVESISADDAFSPYRAPDMMWTDGKFLPALGQPIYTSKSATFWGVEFPASWNRVEEKTIRCGYQRGTELLPGAPYESYRAVFGAADSPEYIGDCFLEYIDQVRATPVELKVQYNSWFDFGGSVTQARFLESVETLHRELVTKRGCRPLDVCVIDDGWQNSRPPRSPLADWSTGLYPVNEKTFDPGLKTVRQAVESNGSKLGLWASPACLFGAAANLEVLEKAGFETLVGQPHPKKVGRKAMSMAGPRYMDLLERRMLELMDMGAVYFKLDGFFGDLSCRYFETKPGRGTPVVSHIIPADVLANDPRLDGPEFDETKRYYVTAGTERLVQMFDAMRRKNPQVRILCHNGATISPWWLMHIDVLSLVNSRDGAPGDRREQMCYRDGLYYQLTRRDGNQVPLCSFFNHEPAKDGNRFKDSGAEAFGDYLFMALSRGTTTVELYFVVQSLTPQDFDTVAEGLKWLYHTSPAFKRSRMHGGSPVGPTGSIDGNVTTKNVKLDEIAEVYGYTGWTESQGYVSIHNPSAAPKAYTFRLDRKFGVIPGSGPFMLSSAHGDVPAVLLRQWSFGDELTITIAPRSVVVLNFDRPGR